VTFEEQVAALRGGVTPRHFQGRKEDATPEQWAASLDYGKSKAQRLRSSPAYRRKSNEHARLAAARARETPEGRVRQNANKRRSCARKKRGAQLWASYRLRLPQYEAATSALGGACAICGEREVGGRRLAVDHDHATGCYRGLLCMNCNMAIGKFRDRPDLLRKAADYLEAGGSPAFDIVTFLKETWSGRDD